MNAIIHMQARSLALDGVGAFSSWLTQQLLAHVFVAGVAYAPPRLLYAALYTTPPSTAGGGVEVAGDPAYRRLVVPFVANPGWPASVVNSAQLVWPTPAADWGNLSALGIWDLAIGGNFLSYGLMLGTDGVTPVTIFVGAGGEPFVVDAGKLTVGLA